MQRRLVQFEFLLVCLSLVMMVGRASAGEDGLSVRLRVPKADPAASVVRIAWRQGGQGLGGDPRRGEIVGEKGEQQLAVGQWSRWVDVAQLTGDAGRGWVFPNISATPTARRKKDLVGLSSVTFEFEVRQAGKVLKSFTEEAPKGATVSLAINGAQIEGLSAYVHNRRERTEKLFESDNATPKQFAIVGHLGGYGEGPDIGKGGASGYGVRHCNPQILADECATMRVLGINGLTGSLRLAERAGMPDAFRTAYFGPPGSGSPMQSLTRGNRKDRPAKNDLCPFDPALRADMIARADAAIENHKSSRARDCWAIWDDEIGVYVKDHMLTCPRCKAEFNKYLAENGVAPADPYPIWNGKGVSTAPGAPADALRYYYTFRFMTRATAQLFPPFAQKFKDAGIQLYSMQAPTPSWNGHSLDWHEFYDAGANTAVVWETSNTDPQVWQLESYLADIARGIAQRHDMAIGTLVKPHRGAPQQRMLSAISRGATAIEWYTYGPDYAKGDSFSQSPWLLEQVGTANRVLAKAEDALYGAHWAIKPEVAFVSPRSSEIWGKANAGDVTAFEDAKWVYLALNHAHVPLDILSEQQLAEGKLAQYKAIYVVGPNLRRDAGAQLLQWVKTGGVLWTDAMGLARDEANQPSEISRQIFGPEVDRKLDRFGSVAPYKAIDLKPFDEKPPPASTFTCEGKPIQAHVGRELRAAAGQSQAISRFADDRPAITRTAVGKGQVIAANFWAGLTYGARCRRSDFNLSEDYEPVVRSLIASAAIDAGAQRAVIPSDPLVEAVLLEKSGQRAIALMNWNYRHDAQGNDHQSRLIAIDNLAITLPPGTARARSVIHGPLRVSDNRVVVPTLAEIDVLLLD